MSHRILKPDAPASRGVFSDVSDMAESYYWWARNSITGAWTWRKKKTSEWTISEFRTDNTVVHHANTEEDEVGGPV